MRLHKGLLLSCDAALKQYLVWLESQPTTIEKFIIQDLDDQHLFIQARPEMAEWLEAQIDAWHDKNSFTSNVMTEAAEDTAGDKPQ
jgi:TFIIH basal transcription factor complex TTD-A subunit